MELPSHYRLYTADTRLDLWDALKDPNHPLNQPWPRFLENDLSHKYFDTMLEFKGLRKYQYAIIELDPTGGETMIAYCRSIPFFWPELEGFEDFSRISAYPPIIDSLPDGGWDTIVSLGIRQHCALYGNGLPASILPILTAEQGQDSKIQTSNRPNALSALSVTVRPDRRGLGLAERLVERMKQTAREEQLRILVVPLRPTRKAEFPFIQMEDYLSWKQGHCSLHELPFDPWLRKHIRLGGKILKIAPLSMVVNGTVIEWQKWTGIDFDQLFLRDNNSVNLKAEPESNREYLEVPLCGGLVPLRFYPREKMCTYTEPNVWLYHEV